MTRDQPSGPASDRNPRPSPAEPEYYSLARPSSPQWIPNRSRAPSATKSPRTRLKNRLRRWFGPMATQDELVLFVLVNALDVGMTAWMLHHGGFTEGNPVALAVIHRWGLKGMVYYKFAVVAVVCTIAHIVAQSRPQLASRMLVFGTLIVGGVVAYSVALFLRHGAPH